MSENSNTDLSWLPSMLQTVDPLFPIGSYAHSYGLEEMVSMGIASTAEDLSDYLSLNTETNLSQLELPYLRFTYKAISNQSWTDLALLDRELEASKLSKEIRHASKAQGQQRLKLLSKLRPNPIFQKLSDFRDTGKITPNHVTIYAAESVALGTPLAPALASWAYQALAAPCAAALKIMRIGQEGSQTVLTKHIQNIPNLVETSLSIERDYAGSFNPLLDIASDRHERAFARLFIS
ncbi:MAG: urease accessory UreF family protein [Verrucomicrobiota bacterium]